MPLSENEQRILDEIENHLQSSDPRLAREVGRVPVGPSSAASLRWWALGLIVGLVIVVAGLTVHFFVSFIGFALMLVSALGLERQLRAVGRSGLEQVSAAIRSANPSIRREPPGDD
ncbi:MAG: DUF3040 domain-containing protein [Acidimicrobiales bacterium]